MGPDYWVSMPFNGQPSFLRVRRREGEFLGVGVSMPYNGQPSFLRGHFERISYIPENGCQCPLTGNHHFYELDGCGGILCYYECQ